MTDGPYDPFVRGPHRVGVRSGAIVDATRDRRLVYEIWYPANVSPAAERDSFTMPARAIASAQQAARDAPVRQGRYPLIAFSHSSYGDRRQSAHLTTHLASHGYVVVAADHEGNSAADFAARAGAAPMTSEERDAYIARIIADRVPDIRTLLDRVLAGAAADVSAVIDATRIGLAGWSFGGWAVLATPEHDERVSAIAALAPAGSRDPLPGIIPATLAFGWKHAASTLVLTGDEDRFTPIAGVSDVFARIPEPKRMFVLRGADHAHFADDVDPTGPSRDQAQLFTRGLAVAHFDAALEHDRDAASFFEGDVAAALRDRGVDGYAGEAEPAG